MGLIYMTNKYNKSFRSQENRVGIIVQFPAKQVAMKSEIGNICVFNARDSIVTQHLIKPQDAVIFRGISLGPF